MRERIACLGHGYKRKTIQLRLLRAELRAGRRWHWCGTRGWWLRCCLLQEQGGTWHLRRFVTTLAQACTFLNIQEDDWTWQEVAPEPAGDKSSQQQAYVPSWCFDEAGRCSPIERSMRRENHVV